MKYFAYLVLVLHAPLVLTNPGLQVCQHRKPLHQTVKDCTYWLVLGYFNNWNIIKLSNKATTSEEIDKIHQVVLDGINENMDALLKKGSIW